MIGREQITKKEQISCLCDHAQEFSKQIPQEKKKIIKALADRHTKLIKSQAVDNLDEDKKKRFNQNEKDLTVKIEYLELFYLTMSEAERSDLEQSIFNILDNTNEISLSEIQNMDREFLSGIKKDEIAEILNLDMEPEKEMLPPDKQSCMVTLELKP